MDTDKRDGLIDIKKLEKKYLLSGGIWRNRRRVVRAVDGVDLQIRQGETLGLVGESGCGKSTLARMIMRLEDKDAGDVHFKGENIFDFAGDALKAYRRSVQMIFQDPYASLNPRQQAESIITEPLKIHQTGNATQIKERVFQMMQKVGLSREQAGRYPHEFSGGQRQRIGIARALALEPQLVIADEPVSALDASIQAQILNLLKDLKSDFGLTYLFVSHDLNVIRHMSDRVAVMYLGRIVELADKNDLYEKPLHPYTRMLLEAMPVCDPKARKPGKRVRGEAAMSDTQGCSFKNRCAYKISMCEDTQPQLIKQPGRGLCACHRASEI
ncbi:MAG: ATP-binding cassette domain-containing protein [Smithellaceae bacterium]